MATTVKASFEGYKSNLELTDRQEGMVASRRATAVSVLSEKLYLSAPQSLVIGSWDRRTLTRYLSEADVDVLVLLDYSKHKDWYTNAGTVQVLDRFKAILKAKDIYKNTDIRRDRNCITMKFSQFRMDLVPAFKHSDGYYLIPDSIRKKWVSTNPIAFATKVTTVNKQMDGSFVPLIKMVKGWNRQQDWPIRSFHLECLLYNHYQSYTQSYTYPSTLRVFFSKLPGYLRADCYDPVLRDRVDTYLDNGALESRRKIAIRKAETAAAKSAEAMTAEGAGKEEKAMRLWNSLMGEFFPAYG